jgi:hypothetical protein
MSIVGNRVTGKYFETFDEIIQTGEKGGAYDKEENRQ